MSFLPAGSDLWITGTARPSAATATSFRNKSYTDQWVTVSRKPKARVVAPRRGSARRQKALAKEKYSVYPSFSERSEMRLGDCGLRGERAMTEISIEHSATVTARGDWRLVIASTLGGLFEWYDFYVYAALAVLLSEKFFPQGNETVAFMGTLAAFGAGFLVRPLGALVFGRLGDVIGRKVTFLVTMSMMGIATIGIGLLPTYATAGIWATISLVVLRLIQGFAHGGETGGAVTYLAEYAPAGRRGLQTSFLQTTAAFGLTVAVLITLGLRSVLTHDQFSDWGWRIPFLISVFLLAMSMYIRSKLDETPVFRRMKAAGQISRSPIAESFGAADNLRKVGLLLIVCSGLGAIFGTCLFHSMFFLNKTIGLPIQTVQGIVCTAVIATAPLYLLFGWLSDRIGRKPVLLAACLLSAVTTFPIFKAMTHYGNPALERFVERTPVAVVAADCQFRLFSPPASDCDRIAAQLSDMGVRFEVVRTGDKGDAEVRVAGQVLSNPDRNALRATLIAAGWPEKADPQQVNVAMLAVLVFLLDLYLAMIFAPIAAFMAELFPARLRYTSMSLPFHLGAGWIGGFLPFSVAAMNIHFGSFYAGLWYPVAISAVVFIVGLFLVPETYKRVM
ncbi:MFS transporter [Bradyrhizobium elkanii]